MNTPTAYDTSLGFNFTDSSCPRFFQDFLARDDFKSCYPMSFYLKNSQSYVRVVRSGLGSVESLLDLSCSVNFDTCKDLMASLGTELIKNDNCLAYYKLENPLVTQAYNDFMAYDMVHQALCLTLADAGDYNNTAQVNSTASHYCYTKALFVLYNYI